MYITLQEFVTYKPLTGKDIVKTWGEVVLITKRNGLMSSLTPVLMPVDWKDLASKKKVNNNIIS
jgi:hypothetical protein